MYSHPQFDEPTANIRAPNVEPRKGPALRCRGLAIGYPEREVAREIDLEVDHGWRAAVVLFGLRLAFPPTSRAHT